MHFPDVTPDLLLTAVFGGFFIGAGIGLAVRGGGVLDGTEIAALLISKRSHLLKVGDVILIFNVVLFLAAMTVLGVEPALYSILTYVTAARTLDFVIYGLEEYTAITIVSSQSAAIRERITGELERGVTVYKGYGGLTGDGAGDPVLRGHPARDRQGQGDRPRRRRARLHRLARARRRRGRRRQTGGAALMSGPYPLKRDRRPWTQRPRSSSKLDPTDVLCDLACFTLLKADFSG